MPRVLDRDERLRDITAAVESIATHSGFSQVTIRGVADRLAMSTTAITHVFSSRDEMLRYVVDRSIGRRCDQIDAAIEGRHGPEAMRALIEWVVLGPADEAHRLWLALVLAAPGEPVLRERLDEFNEWWSQRLASCVVEVDDAEREALLDVIDVVVNGLIVAGVETDEVWDTSRRRRVLTTVFGRLGL